MSDGLDTETLKPCPFCGGAGTFTVKKGMHRVECENLFSSCRMNMRTLHCGLKEDAAKAWNTRILEEEEPDHE